MLNDSEASKCALESKLYALLHFTLSFVLQTQHTLHTRSLRTPSYRGNNTKLPLSS